MLEKTGCNTAYMCKELLDKGGRDELLKDVKQIWDQLEHENPNVTKKKFVFKRRSQRIFKAIGDYANSHDISYFANFDEDGAYENESKRKRSKSIKSNKDVEKTTPKTKKQCIEPKPSPSSKMAMITYNKSSETNAEKVDVDPVKVKLLSCFKTL